MSKEEDKVAVGVWIMVADKSSTLDEFYEELEWPSPGPDENIHIQIGLAAWSPYFGSLALMGRVLGEAVTTTLKVAEQGSPEQRGNYVEGLLEWGRWLEKIESSLPIEDLNK